jgi:hypothetical protein
MAPALLVHRAPVRLVSMRKLEQLEIALAGEALNAFTPAMARVAPNTAVSLRMLAPIDGGLVGNADQERRMPGLNLYS